MKATSKLTTLGLLATIAAASVTPALADGWGDRNNDQANKNTMRNLTIAGAAVAAYGLFSHNGPATLLGAAGAALAGSQYEKDRKDQSQDNNRYYYRDGRNNGDRNRYDQNGGYQNQYDRNGYDQNQYDRQDNNNHWNRR